jgi:hypothetical protein
MSLVSITTPLVRRASRLYTLSETGPSFLRQESAERQSLTSCRHGLIQRDMMLHLLKKGLRTMAICQQISIRPLRERRVHRGQPVQHMVRP